MTARMLGLDDDDDALPAPAPLPEAMVMDLRQQFDTYAAMMANGCPFKPGDIVTPRNGHNQKGIGMPQIVLELNAAHLAAPDTSESIFTSRYGVRLDMRVSCASGGDHLYTRF
ncbi:hypothetical protein [Methylobrevis pamukkalensis]|nr:hypothetical protein [Methylobrevis pamukkalensis]